MQYRLILLYVLHHHVYIDITDTSICDGIINLKLD